MRNFKTERNYRTGMAAFALLCSLTLTACQGTQNTDGSSQKESTRDFFAMDTYMTGNRLFLICLKLLTSLGKVEIDLMKQKNIGEYSTKTELLNW